MVFNWVLGGSKEADLHKIAAQEKKNFSFDTLFKATDKFHPSRKLGEGGFGPVFKVSFSYFFPQLEIYLILGTIFLEI